VRRLLTWRWILVHLTAVVLVVAFLLLCWWQIDRARGGNMLSYGYAIEWPAFAIFVVYVWIKEVRTELQRAEPDAPAPAPRPVIRASARAQRAGAAYDDSGDEELAAYNRYLAWLNANPGATPAQYPG
jgi:DNA-binding transcriptional regulator of glucitol operon